MMDPTLEWCILYALYAGDDGRGGGGRGGGGEHHDGAHT
jgi:hypothetical protein